MEKLDGRCRSWWPKVRPDLTELSRMLPEIVPKKHTTVSA